MASKKAWSCFSSGLNASVFALGGGAVVIAAVAGCVLFARRHR
jgi:hypothetical protein